MMKDERTVIIHTPDNGTYMKYEDDGPRLLNRKQNIVGTITTCKLQQNPVWVSVNHLTKEAV